MCLYRAKMYYKNRYPLSVAGIQYYTVTKWITAVSSDLQSTNKRCCRGKQAFRHWPRVYPEQSVPELYWSRKSSRRFLKRGVKLHRDVGVGGRFIYICGWYTKVGNRTATLWYGYGAKRLWHFKRVQIVRYRTLNPSFEFLFSTWSQTKCSLHCIDTLIKWFWDVCLFITLSPISVHVLSFHFIQDSDEDLFSAKYGLSATATLRKFLSNIVNYRTHDLWELCPRLDMHCIGDPLAIVAKYAFQIKFLDLQSRDICIKMTYKWLHDIFLSDIWFLRVNKNIKT